MQNTDIPQKLPLPFGAAAAAGYIRTIPTASQIGVVDGAASLTDGFPPLNATPIGAGGVPPDIKDMNGILFEISGWARWVAAGGPVYFDAAFATAIGGYPKGAVIQSATTPGLLYVSTANNNSNNPDGGGANWAGLVAVPATLAELITGTNAAKFVTPATLAGLRATSAQILVGTDPARYMTPAAFYGARASGADVAAGTDDHKYVTPLGLAASNSAGIVRLPGGLVMQYGTIVAPRVEGAYFQPFNTPFANAVDAVSLTALNNNNYVRKNTWIQWNKSATSLSSLAYMVQWTSESGTVGPDGVSWVAYGR